MTDADFAVTSMLVFIVIGTLTLFVMILGAWKLEKKGYSFWGALCVSAATIQPLGPVGAALFVLGVSLLAPERRE